MTFFKHFSLVLFFLLPISAHAYEELSFEDFFAQQENVEKFNELVAAGNMQKIRNNMASICQKSNTDKPDIKRKCECLAGKLQSVSDKELLYASITAYKRFQAKVHALKTDNQAELEQIKQFATKHPLMDESLEHQCNPH